MRIGHGRDFFTPGQREVEVVKVSYDVLDSRESEASQEQPLQGQLLLLGAVPVLSIPCV